MVSYTTDTDTGCDLLNCTYVYPNLWSERWKKENKLCTQVDLGFRSRNMTKKASRVLPYVSSVRSSKWDMKPLKFRCIPLVSGSICAGHLVSVWFQSIKEQADFTREIQSGKGGRWWGKRLEVKEWKHSRKEIGAWRWLRARGRAEVDEISIYTTPHS